MLKDKITHTRAAMRISQTEYAKMIGSNQTEVSFMERGFIPEDVEKIKTIEKLYEETLQYRKGNNYD